MIKAKNLQKCEFKTGPVRAGGHYFLIYRSVIIVSQFKTCEYICEMEDALYNPVYNALLSGDARLSIGEGVVKYFDEQVSPFVGFPQGYDKGFDDLYDQLPAGRKILYATPEKIHEPEGWQVAAEMEGLQFVFAEGSNPVEPSIKPIPLNSKTLRKWWNWLLLQNRVHLVREPLSLDIIMAFSKTAVGSYDWSTPAC
jgi:hypothetical protein